MAKIFGGNPPRNAMTADLRCLMKKYGDTSRRNVTVKIRPVSTVPGYVVYHKTRDVSGQSLFS